MIITSLDANHIDEFIDLVDEYRESCGFEKSPKNSKLFFEELIKGRKSQIFIAVSENNEVMGFVNLYPSFSTLSLRKIWILNDLGVSSKFRRFGVAQALIQKAIQFAQESGAIRIELKTEQKNTKAQKLYSKLGFTIDKDNIYYRVPI